MKLIVICAISLATVGCCNALIECYDVATPITTSEELPITTPEEPPITTPEETINEESEDSPRTPEDTNNGDQDNEPGVENSNNAPEEPTTEQPTDKPEITPLIGNCTPWETWQSINEGDICGCATDYDGTQTSMIVVGKTDSGVSICGLYS